MSDRREGRIGITTLPAVVRDLWRSEATGALHLSKGSIEKSIYFRRGEIVFAGTNLENERLGERLVRAGKIKRSVLEMAIRVMGRSHERIGKTIVEWGWISPLELQRWVATQIKDIIYSVFTWSSGEYRFEPTELPLPDDLALEIPTAEVIYEGARRISDLRAIRAGVGSPSGTLALVDERTRPGIPVTHEDGFLLSRIDSSTTILDIVSSSPLGEEESLRRLYALMLAGVIERAEGTPKSTTVSAASSASRSDRPSAPLSDAAKNFRDTIIARHVAMKFGNFYDRLGVSSGASTQQIQDAYDEVKRSLNPDPSCGEIVSELESRLEEVSRKVEEAYQTLSNPEIRREYDRSLSGGSPESTMAALTQAARTLAAPPLAKRPDKSQEAELYYIEANRSWQAGDYFDAVASMNEAVRLDPDKAQYHRLLGKWLSENPSCTDAAVEHFERAIRLDPKDRESYVGLANLLEQEGMTDRAKEVQEKLASVELR